MSVKMALNTMIGLQGRLMTISRPGTITESLELGLYASVKFAPSNYARNLEGPSDTVIRGREFIVTKDSLDLNSYPTPKRGDKLQDASLGVMTISEIIEMHDIGGSIIGFRLRIS